MGKFYIGWAEESLVPDKKVDLRGQFFERISTHVESEISVTATAATAISRQKKLSAADITAHISRPATPATRAAICSSARRLLI